MKIAIVDYGTGNLRSVGQAVKAVADGADVLVTQSAAEIDAADRVIFPGQGAQYTGMGMDFCRQFPVCSSCCAYCATCIFCTFCSVFPPGDLWHVLAVIKGPSVSPLPCRQHVCELFSNKSPEPVLPSCF